MAGRKVEEVSAKCGCIVIPLIASKITKEVHCPAHGWQKLDPKPTVRQIAGITYEKPVFPLEPPF